jgi:hypothetical protein
MKFDLMIISAYMLAKIEINLFIIISSIPKNKEEFYSDSLFSSAEVPCKIVIAFIESNKKNGTYHTNPVSFKLT